MSDVPAPGDGTRVAAVLARHDPGGFVYGAVVAAATLATVSAEVAHVERVAPAVLVVLTAYWLAHVYVATQRMLFERHGRRLHHRLRSAAVEELSVMWGGLPAVGVYVTAHWVLGLDDREAALTALWASVVLLLGLGFLGAHRAGMRGWGLLLESLGAGSLGLVAVAAKFLLH